MNGSEMTGALSTLLSLGGLYVVLFWLLPDYRVDAFRQNLFVVRDRLFDEARSGGIAFDHPAYGLLRMTINGYMRFGHRLTGFQILLFGMTLRRDLSNGKPPVQDLDFQADWEASLRGLDKKTKERLEAIRHRMDVEAVKHVVFRSRLLAPMACLILAALFVVIAAAKAAHYVLRRSTAGLSTSAARQTIQRSALARRAIAQIDSLAMANGDSAAAGVS